MSILRTYKNCFIHFPLKLYILLLKWLSKLSLLGLHLTFAWHFSTLSFHWRFSLFFHFLFINLLNTNFYCTKHYFYSQSWWKNLNSSLELGKACQKLPAQWASTLRTIFNLKYEWTYGYTIIQININRAWILMKKYTNKRGNYILRRCKYI